MSRYFVGSHYSLSNNSNSRELPKPGSTKNNSRPIASSGHYYCSSNYNEPNNLRVSNQDLEMKSKEYQRDFQRLVKENELQQKNFYEKSQELENLSVIYENAEMTRKKYEEKFKRLRKKYDEQKNDLNDLKTKLENLEGKHDELEMNYDELKKNSGELKRNYELKNSSIIQLEKKIDTLENEKINSIKKIEELEADLQKKQNAVITIRNKYKTLQNTNDELSGLTIFKIQSLSLQKQNEDFICQLNILTKSNENLSTQLELIKNENNQLKAEIKNLKLLKFTSKSISSISTYNIQDSHNFIDENKISQVKNEHSTLTSVNNEIESSNKAKNNVNYQKFPAWWYNHMSHEISTIKMESTTMENIKSKSYFNDTKSLMFTGTTDLQNSDIEDYNNYINDNEKSQVKNKNSAQTCVNIVNQPIRNDENYHTKHSNQKYRAS